MNKPSQNKIKEGDLMTLRSRVRPVNVGGPVHAGFILVMLLRLYAPELPLQLRDCDKKVLHKAIISNLA